MAWVLSAGGKTCFKSTQRSPSNSALPSQLNDDDDDDDDDDGGGDHHYCHHHHYRHHHHDGGGEGDR